MTTEKTSTTKPAAAKKVKRTFKLSVVVDRAKMEFSPGLGIGVLTSVEVAFNLTEAQYAAPMFALSLLDQARELQDSVIKLRAVEVLPEAKAAKAAMAVPGAKPAARRKTAVPKKATAPAAK